MRIEKIKPWREECDDGLSLALREDRAEIIAGVNSGALECYRLWGGEAYMVTRTENGVVTMCCYQGKRLLEAAIWVIAQCQRLGMRQVRFHTAIDAIPRLVRSVAPWRLHERVYVADVPKVKA